MKKKTVIVPLVVVVLGLAAVASLRVAFPEERLLRLLEPKLTATLGRPVHIGHAELQWMPLAVRASDVRLDAAPGFASDVLLQIEQLRCDLQILALLRRQISIRSLVIDRPELVLEQLADGRWNYEAKPSAKARAAAEPAESTAAELVIEKFQILDGHVRVKSAADDYELILPLGAELRLSADRALNNVELGGWIETAGLSGGETGRFKALNNIKLRLEPTARIALADSTAHFEPLRVQLQNLRLELTGVAALENGKPRLQLRTVSKDIDLAELLSLVPRQGDLANLVASGIASLDLNIDVKPPSVPVIMGSMALANGRIESPDWPEALQRIQAKFEWVGESLRLENFEAHVGASPFRARGQILSPLKSSETSYDLELVGAVNLKLVEKLATLPEGTHLDGLAGVSVKLTGKTSDPNSLRIVGPITLEDVTVTTANLAQDVKVRAKLHSDGEVLKIETAKLTAGDSEVAVEGSVQPLHPDATPRLTLRARAGQLDLDALLPAASGATSSATSASAPRSLLPPNAVNPIELSLQIDRARLQQADWQGVQIDFNGTPGGFQLELSADELQRDTVTLQDLEGALQGDASRATGTMRAAQGKMGRIRGTNLRSNVTIEGTTVTLRDLKSQTYQGNLQGNAEVDLADTKSPSYQLELTAEQIDSGLMLRDVTSIPGLLSGRLGGTSKWSGRGSDPAALRRNLSASGTGSAINGKLRDIPLLEAVAKYVDLPNFKNISYRDLGFRFEVAEGRVHFPKLELAGSEADMVATGNVGMDGQLNLDLNVVLSPELSRAHARGKVAAALSTVFSDADGRIVLDFNVTGPVAAPRLQPDLSATRARVGLTALNELDLNRFLRGLPQAQGVETVIEDAVGNLGDKIRGGLGGLLGGKKDAAADSTAKPE